MQIIENIQSSRNLCHKIDQRNTTGKVMPSKIKPGYPGVLHHRRLRGGRDDGGGGDSGGGNGGYCMRLIVATSAEILWLLLLLAVLLQVLLPLQLLLSSVFATSAKRIYQVRLELGPAGTAAAFGAVSSVSSHVISTTTSMVSCLFTRWLPDYQ